jgi:hypothetical protein
MLEGLARKLDSWEGVAVPAGPGVLEPAHAAQLCDGARWLAARLPRLETPLAAAQCYGAQRKVDAPLDPEEFLAGAGFPLDEWSRQASAKRLGAHLPRHRLDALCQDAQETRRRFLLGVLGVWEKQCRQAAKHTGLALGSPRVDSAQLEGRPHLSANGLAPGFVATVLAAGLSQFVELPEGTPTWRQVGYQHRPCAGSGRPAADPAGDAVTPVGPLAAAFAGGCWPEVGEVSMLPGEVEAVPIDRPPLTPATAAINTEHLQKAYATSGVLIGRSDLPGGPERLTQVHLELSAAFGRSPEALDLARLYTEAAQATEALRQALRALAPAEFEPGPCDLCGTA